MSKSEEVRVAISSQLKQKLKAKYEALGVSESDYIRSLLIEDLKKG